MMSCLSESKHNSNYNKNNRQDNWTINVYVQQLEYSSNLSDHVFLEYNLGDV